MLSTGQAQQLLGGGGTATGEQQVDETVRKEEIELDDQSSTGRPGTGRA